MLGKIQGRRRKGQQRMRWLDGTTDSMDLSLSTLWEIVKDTSLVCCCPWGCKESDITEGLNNNLYSHSDEAGEAGLGRSNLPQEPPEKAVLEGTEYNIRLDEREILAWGIQRALASTLRALA